DVVDERGRRQPGMGMGGGAFNLLFSLLVSRFGIVGAVLAAGAIFLFSHMRDLGSGDSSVAVQEPPARTESGKPNDPRVAFVSFVLDDVQNTWAKLFEREGRTYEHAKLVLFDGATQT